MTAPWNTIYCVQSSPPNVWHAARAQSISMPFMESLRRTLRIAPHPRGADLLPCQEAGLDRSLLRPKEQQSQPVQHVHVQASAPPTEESPSLPPAFSLDCCVDPILLNAPIAQENEDTAPPPHVRTANVQEEVKINPIVIPPPTIQEDSLPPDVQSVEAGEPDPRAKIHAKSRVEKCGLLQFKHLWYLNNVSISVRGEMLNGVPISIRKDAVRMVNDDYSYLIPLHCIDYIRTPDGLKAAEDNFTFDVFGKQ